MMTHMIRLCWPLVSFLALGSMLLGQDTVSTKELSGPLSKALDKYFAMPEEQRANCSFAPALNALVTKDPERTRQVVWKSIQRAAKGSSLEKDFGKNQVHNGDLRSPYTIKKVGKRPANGWPLFIAMHGGGGVPKKFNDSQWRHMQIYYRDQKSVEGYKYLALRAPTDSWNGFYTGYIYPLIMNLIRQFLLFGDVNPDRVFVMGYSHGGYGAFAIGPTLADRFAAVHASASAPTGAETQACNLRNTIFTFMVGERDTAYGRLSRCQGFAKQIEKLRGERTDIYPVTFEFKKGYGHGGLPDRDKIKTMYPAVRNATPKDLTWNVAGGHVRDHFWLHVPQGGSSQSVKAQIEGNTVQLATTGIEEVNLVLDSRHLDFDQPVEIKVGDQTTKVTLTPNLQALCDSMLRRGDAELAGTVIYRVKL